MKTSWIKEPCLLASAMWLVFLLDFVIPVSETLGIGPRTLSGSIGIILSPLVHGGLLHILYNTIPFVVMGTLVRAHGRVLFWRVTIYSALLSGLTAWLFSLADLVVGASGVIFGYWAFLIAYGIFKRSALSLVTAIAVLLLYGGMLLSLFLFFIPGVSWISHFSGAVAGLVMANWTSRAENP